jgi:hypothetical protein
LRLRPDSLDRPIRLDLAHVEALMLWPDDDDARERWQRAAIIDEGKDHLDEMPENLLRHYARDALNAPRLADLQPEAGKRKIEGLLAGIVLLNATTYAHHAPERAALGIIKQELCDNLRGTYQVQPRTLDNRNEYRPVAHFWAAYMLACHHGDRTFPCQIADLATFLATAEALRELAETSNAKKAPGPIMRPGEAARLPDDVVAALPAVRIDIAV